MTNNSIDVPIIPAAVMGLYQSHEIASRRKKLTSHKYLSNADMKLLARILRGVPFPSTPPTKKKYEEKLKQQIHDLPSHLRSTSPGLTSTEDNNTGRVKSGRLCSVHQDLGSRLVSSIWEWVTYQLDKRIGQYMYPVIMHGGLTSHQEWQARQLEPVLQMYHADFTVGASPPPGREPINPGYIDERGEWVPKFGYQANQCPACMLARIGSHVDVLSALFSGIVAHMSSGHVGHRDDIRSVRVRFVKYWIKANKGGGKIVEQAWKQGKEIRRMRKQWKAHRRRTGECGKREDTGSTEGLGIIYEPYSCPADPTPETESAENLLKDERLDRSCLAPSQHDTVGWYDDQEDMIISLDIPESSVSCQSDADTRALLDPPSSVYSRNTGDQTLYNGLKRSGAIRRPTLSAKNVAVALTSYVQQEQTPVVRSYAPSVHSQSGHYSFTSSVDSFNNRPIYDSRHTSAMDAGADSQPQPLHIANTSREQVREDMLLPRPNLASIYGEFGNPFYNDDMYWEVSPPGSPVSQAGARGTDGTSPPVTPISGVVECGASGEYNGGRADISKHALDPPTAMTRWSDLY